MKRENCILLMTKYPERGGVKTRLGKDIGKDNSTELYIAFLQDILETLNNSGIPFIVYYYPKERSKHLRDLLGDGLTYIHQVGRDLGERLIYGLRTAFSLGFESASALASDVPDIPSSILLEAKDRLETGDAVIGPSPDGGYYLIGFTQASFLPEAFHGIPWSTETVYRDTLQRLRARGLNTHVLESWPDIDNKQDLMDLLHNHGQGFTGSHTLDYLLSNQGLMTVLNRVKGFPPLEVSPRHSIHGR
jgi:hypothetical protein